MKRRPQKALENNWRYKNLENLEKETWPEPEGDSHLIRRTHALRKVPLNEFAVEDLRIMIGQDIGLRFLIPLAIEALAENILAEGDLYPGDLLEAVAKSNAGFWEENPDHKNILQKMMLENAGLIHEHNLKASMMFIA